MDMGEQLAPVRNAKIKGTIKISKLKDLIMARVFFYDSHDFTFYILRIPCRVRNLIWKINLDKSLKYSFSHS